MGLKKLKKRLFHKPSIKVVDISTELQCIADTKKMISHKIFPLIKLTGVFQKVKFE